MRHTLGPGGQVQLAAADQHVGVQTSGRRSLMLSHAGAASLRTALSRQYDCNDPHVIASGATPRSTVLITRKYSQSPNFGTVTAEASDDAFLLAVELQGGRRQRVRDGASNLEQTYARNDISIRSLAQPHQARFLSPFDSLFVYLPREALDLVTQDLGTRPVVQLETVEGAPDPVLALLAKSLLPSLDGSQTASTQFVDHIVSAIAIHLASRYGGLQVPSQANGGLSRWQQKRALEFMTSRGLHEVSVADIAAECRLSRSYFIKAFRQSLGDTPHRWLIKYRVEKAKEMLLRPNASIAEIADACGFVDQSHLTRVFTNTVGAPPGVWRRQYRLAS